VSFISATVLYLLGAKILSVATLDALAVIDIALDKLTLRSFRNFASENIIYWNLSSTDLVKKVKSEAQPLIN
jgi:uncharacterized membrane protein (Fun14 family)